MFALRAFKTALFGTPHEEPESHKRVTKDGNHDLSDLSFLKRDFVVRIYIRCGNGICEFRRHGRTVNSNTTAHSITAMAESESADLIVMASHGRGGADRADRIPIGSVAERVVEEAPCPVLLIPVRS